MHLLLAVLFFTLIPITTSFNLTSLASILTLPVMHSFASLAMVGSLAIQAVLSLPEPNRIKEREAELLKRSVDSFIATESPIAMNDLLCNIGAAGTCAAGAHSGVVIASPDKVNPNCKIV